MHRVPSLASFLELNKFFYGPLCALFDMKTIRASRDYEREKILFEADRSPYDELVQMSMHRGAASLNDFFMSIQLIGGGPKIFRPTDDQAEAMERILPRLLLDDYHQPVETFGVELPLV